jgi:hypothetical protein
MKCRRNKNSSNLVRTSETTRVTLFSKEICFNQWFSGFFDVNGAIEYYLEKDLIIISVTNKFKSDLKPFHDYLGGDICFYNAQNGYYKWSIKSESDITKFINYIKVYTPKSIKLYKLYLINTYYRLVKLKAYNQLKQSNPYKNWSDFQDEWNKY